MPYTAAVVQFGVEAFLRGPSDREHLATNSARLIEWVRFLNDGTIAPPRLIVFPILPLVGSSIRPVPPNRTPVRLAGPLDPLIEPLVAACARYDCYLALSHIEVHPDLPGDVFHTGFVLNGNGVVLRQPKFIPHSADEVERFRESHRRYLEVLGPEALNQVVETPLGRIGSLLDRDLLIPEVGRGRAKAGAQVIVHPSLAWPGEVVRHVQQERSDLAARPWKAVPDDDVPFEAMRRSLAYQNCFFLLTANHAYERWERDGVTQLHTGRGGSMIAGPDGRVLAKVNAAGEGFALATIDPSAADRARTDHGEVSLPIWEIYAGTYSEGGRRKVEGGIRAARDSKRQAGRTWNA